MLNSSAMKFVFALVSLVFASGANAATLSDPESTVQAFHVNAGFDSTLLFYSPSLSSTNPFVNVEAASDDMVSIGISGFTSIQAAGVSHSLIRTGHANYDADLFTGSISGDETITLTGGSDIPLPAAIPLLAAGLAGVAYLGRRKRHVPELATR